MALNLYQLWLTLQNLANSTHTLSARGLFGCALATCALAALFVLQSCTAPYERFMQEGKENETANKLDDARKSYHRAGLEAKKDSKDKNKEKLLAALNAEADACAGNKQTQDAIEVLAQARVALLAGNQVIQAAETSRRMGALAMSASDFVGAGEYYKQGLEDLKNAGMDKSELRADLLAALAELHISGNRFKEAARLLQEAYTIMSELQDADNHLQSTIMNRLAFVYQQLGMDDEALDLMEAAKKVEVSGVKERVKKLPKI